MLRQRPILNGIEYLKEIPNISLYQLNNLLTEMPIFEGLKLIEGKTYGIIATIKKIEKPYKLEVSGNSSHK